MAFKRIEDSDLKGKGNVGRPDTPGVDTAEMQRILDEIPREIIVPAFNALVDALNKGDGANGITVTVPDGVPAETANNLNAVLAALGAELIKRVISDDVKKIRLNSFGELEVSTDGSKFTVASSRGHVIEDGLDNTYTQRRKLRFKFTKIEDDPDSDATVVYGLPGPEGPPGPGGVVTDLDPGLFALTVDEEGNVFFAAQRRRTHAALLHRRGQEPDLHRIGRGADQSGQYSRAAGCARCTGCKRRHRRAGAAGAHRTAGADRTTGPERRKG